MSLNPQELDELKSKLERDPTPTELQIVAAEWSEHCSYKSSKTHLKILPMDGPHVIKEKGYDSGVLDVGDGYVITAHIESHNHPSAVEPYGGAATGVGGVIRDILSAGTRPIAVLDGLRFGDITHDMHSRWLFKNAVAGIADYGNCLGIPTVGGEVEFDKCYTNYALVDVAAIGFGKKSDLIKNHANNDDLVVLIGGPTGRDGIGGSQFASDSFAAEDRSAVQIPDPFAEKLIIEAIIEARRARLIHALKDLGGGGLSCAISETADALNIGMKIDIDLIHTREQDMRPDEIMISESQERMLVITNNIKLGALEEICAKFSLECSVIGNVTANGYMHITKNGETCANMPANIVANATLLNLPSRKPTYLTEIESKRHTKDISDLSTTLLDLLSDPNIASKQHIYNQYDHEVGIRTIIRPGYDAALLRLDNGKFLAVTMDGSPKHCYINPREGAIGCFEEACRNVVCTGAKPIGMLDHLQFGNPNDPEIFWTFLESVHGLSDYAKYIDVPCVGGKVSLYNDTLTGPIKPTPVIGVLGISDKMPIPYEIREEDILVLVGYTRDEMGGSEYYEYIHDIVGGCCPKVVFDESKTNMSAVLDIMSSNLSRFTHDCSKGGLGVAIAEMCMLKQIGCTIHIDQVKSDPCSDDILLFSESHSRYLLTVDPVNISNVRDILDSHNATFAIIGMFGGDSIKFLRSNDIISELRIDKAQKIWINSLRDSMRYE